MTELIANLRDVITDIVKDEVKRALADVTPAPAPSGPDAEYIDDRQLAAWLGMSRETIQQQRCRGEGPPFIKVARKAVRYHVPTVRAWLKDQQRGK